MKPADVQPVAGLERLQAHDLGHFDGQVVVQISRVERDDLLVLALVVLGRPAYVDGWPHCFREPPSAAHERIDRLRRGVIRDEVGPLQGLQPLLDLPVHLPRQRQDRNSVPPQLQRGLPSPQPGLERDAPRQHQQQCCRTRGGLRHPRSARDERPQCQQQRDRQQPGDTGQRPVAPVAPPYRLPRMPDERDQIDPVRQTQGLQPVPGEFLPDRAGERLVQMHGGTEPPCHKVRAVFRQRAEYSERHASPPPSAQHVPDPVNNRNSTVGPRDLAGQGFVNSCRRHCACRFAGPGHAMRRAIRSGQWRWWRVIGVPFDGLGRTVADSDAPRRRRVAGEATCCSRDWQPAGLMGGRLCRV